MLPLSSIFTKITYFFYFRYSYTILILHLYDFCLIYTRTQVSIYYPYYKVRGIHMYLSFRQHVKPYFFLYIRRCYDTDMYGTMCVTEEHVYIKLPEIKIYDVCKSTHYNLFE